MVEREKMGQKVMEEIIPEFSDVMRKYQSTDPRLSVKSKK